MSVSPSAPHRLGTVTSGSATSDPPNAPTAYTETRRYTVSVPGLTDAVVALARREPVGTERGTVVMSSGGDGSGWWGGTTDTEALVKALADDGWRVIQRFWQTGWVVGSLGMAVSAGRAATMIRYIYDTWADPGLPFVWTGNSGGACEAAYTCGRYWCDDILTHLIMSGGPPMSDLTLGCSADGTYGFTDASRALIDDAYGSSTACFDQDATERGAQWWDDSLLVGHLQWHADSTFIWGTADNGEAPHQGALLAAHQADAVTVYPVGTPHDTSSDARGRAAVADAIYGRPTIRQAKLDNQSPASTSITVTFDETVEAGSLLVCTHLAQSTDPGDVNTPSGWTLGPQVDLGGLHTLSLFYKVATGAETGVTVTTAGAANHACDLFEAHKRGATTWTLDQSTTTTTGSATTMTIGPTSATTDETIAIACATFSGSLTLNDDWTDDFVAMGSNDGARLTSATAGRHATAAQQTTITWTTSRIAGGILAAFRPT